MKMKNVTFIPIFVCALFSLSGKRDYTYQGFNLKEFEKSFSSIPEGNLSYTVNKAIIPEKQPLQKTKTLNVKPFYMYKHEVSNGEYLEFVNDLKRIGSELYTKMLPDTTVWNQKLSYCEPYRLHYFRHPAYSNYPVVGITYEQAEYYCNWLTQRYMNEKNRKFKNVKFKLPELTQWVLAGSGQYFLKDAKGNFEANFRIVSQTTICREIKLDENTYRKDIEAPVWVQTGDHLSPFDEPLGMNQGPDITAPVVFYPPNNYGLFNMFGNVEEYVREKGITKGGSWHDTGYYLQIDVEEKYDSTNYTSAERGFRFVMELIN